MLLEVTFELEKVELAVALRIARNVKVSPRLARY